MFRIVCSLVCLCTLSTFFVGCSQTESRTSDTPVPSPTQAVGTTPAQAADLPPNVVEVSATELALTPGGTAEAVVSIKIADGYHINGNPASKFQIPTTLDVDALDGITPGKPVYPPSVTKKFAFSEEPITVYEHEAIIKQPLTVAARVPSEARSLRGKVRVQPCDDKVCYPPRTLEVSLPVVVR